MNAFYSECHKQHEAGWQVFLDGECIAELDYLHDDQPFHLFHFTSITDDPRKLDYALRSTAMREPDSRVEFHNRVFPLRVPDGPFLVNLHEPATVYIRDFRMPSDATQDDRNA